MKVDLQPAAWQGWRLSWSIAAGAVPSICPAPVKINELRAPAVVPGLASRIPGGGESSRREGDCRLTINDYCFC